ncbi:MAG: hypothetical protein Q9167_002925 [Letrouitia subvulpina]
MPAPSLPDHCSPTSLFLTSISSTFHTCVPTPLAFLSITLGILSIASWLFAQVPQIFKNYTLKSASGLSIYFLAEWLLGDLANLLGALFTKQAAWQVVVAAYYVTMDICLVCQFVWYSNFKPWREKPLTDINDSFDDGGDGPAREVLVGVSQSDDGFRKLDSTRRSSDARGRSDTKHHSQPKASSNNPFHSLNFSWSLKEKGTPNSSHRTIRRLQQSPSPAPSPHTLLLLSFLFTVLANASPLTTLSEHHGLEPQSENAVEISGRVLSWMSTLLYLGSRLPQIYKNLIRRSTSGLSPTLFIAAFFGNFFYSTSMLANPLAWGSYPPYGLHGWVGPEGNNRFIWIKLAIPFFLGAAGVLMMDAIVGVQFLIFGEGEDSQKVVVVKDERGRSHWRKVTGWMRGWIPSPSPNRTEDEIRPLLENELENETPSSNRYGLA